MFAPKEDRHDEMIEAPASYRAVPYSHQPLRLWLESVRAEADDLAPAAKAPQPRPDVPPPAAVDPQTLLASTLETEAAHETMLERLEALMAPSESDRNILLR